MTKRERVNILLVEDNTADAKLLHGWMRKSKLRYRLDVVSDGQEAMDYLHQTGRFSDMPRPHFILLDLNLPKLSGFEVLEQVKANPALKEIPIVVLTASAIAEDLHRAYDLEASDYLSKPATADEYRETVTAIEEFWDEHQAKVSQTE